MPGTGVTSISPRYVQELQTASKLHVISKAEVWAGESLLYTFNLEPATQLTVGRANQYRRSATVVLTDPAAGTSASITPTDAKSIFAPYGNELVLYGGLHYDDGTPDELIQMGVLGMEKVVVYDSRKDLVITLTAYDRSRAIQRAGFTDAYSVLPSTNMGSEIQRLLSGAQTGLTLAFNLAQVSAVTPSTPPIYKPGDDRWKMAVDLAGAAGCQLYPDPTGAIVLLQVQDPSQAPIAWSYEDGAANLSTEMTRTIDRGNAPNYFIRIGQGTGIAAPVQGISFDNDPTSPTYVGGRYGLQGPDVKSSSLYATADQAQAAAVADQLLAKGTIETLDFKAAAARPDHDADNVVEVTRQRVGLADELYVLDGFTWSPGSAALSDIAARQITANGNS